MGGRLCTVVCVSGGLLGIEADNGRERGGNVEERGRLLGLDAGNRLERAPKGKMFVKGRSQH